MGLIEKLGFKECNREENSHIIKGILYDGLTFKLDIERYKVFEKEYNIIK